MVTVSSLAEGAAADRNGGNGTVPASNFLRNERAEPSDSVAEVAVTTYWSWSSSVSLSRSGALEGIPDVSLD